MEAVPTTHKLMCDWWKAVQSSQIKSDLMINRGIHLKHIYFGRVCLMETVAAVLRLI